MKKKTAIILTGIVVLAALAAGLWWWRQAGNASPAYREASVTRGRIELTVQSTGIVQPRNRLEIKPPLAGRAEQVLVQEGQAVKKVQVLLWMSSSERAALIDAARARGPEEVRRWEEFYRATPVSSPIDGGFYGGANFHLFIELERGGEALRRDSLPSRGGRGRSPRSHR